MESENKPNWMIVAVFIFVCILIASVILGIWCEKMKINDNNVIIGFIGVLATFVVVGNYAQTVDMRNQTENKIKKLEKQLNEAKKQLGDAEKLNNDLAETIENFKNKYDTIIKKELLRIVNSKNKTITQSGTFGVGNKKVFNDIKEVREEDGTKYNVEFSDSIFLVDIIEETATKLS